MNTNKSSFIKLLLFTTVIIATPLEISANSNQLTNYPITLFYPGQSSWEWLLTKHSAAKSVRKGTPCLECHEDEEKEMGNIIAKGEKLEPSPIELKPGYIDANINTQFDDKNLYIDIRWKDTKFSSNLKKTGKFKTKVTIMLGDKSVREFPVAGCWGVCHDDATNMKSFKGEKKRELYTSASRVKLKRTGGGDDVIDSEDLSENLSENKFLEYWQAAILPDIQTETSQGYILEKRHKQTITEVNTTAVLENNVWHVHFSRPLQSSLTGALNFKTNHHYTIGFAIHDDYVEGRRHYVSFGRSFSLGDQSSDITATQQKL